MDKKFSVWLVVLLVLLVAALAGVVMVKNQLDESRAALVSASDQLAQEQENARTLTEQLQSAEEESARTAEEAQSLRQNVDSLSAEIDSLSGQIAEKDGQIAEKDSLIAVKDGLIAEKDAQIAVLEQAALAAPVPTAAPAETAAAEGDRNALATGLDRILLQIAEISADGMTAEEQLAALGSVEAELTAYAGQLQTALEAADAEKTGLEAELAAANASVEALNAQIELGRQTISNLEAQLAAADAAETASEDASAEAEDASAAEIAALSAQLEAERAAVSDLTAQLQSALAEYGNALVELRLYKLSRDPEAGAHYASNALGSEIAVAADGISAALELENSILSANSLSFELVLDGEPIAASELLLPGESLDALTLAAPLAAGEYGATAVLKTVSAAGEELSGQRLPVRITVAAE